MPRSSLTLQAVPSKIAITQTHPEYSHENGVRETSFRHIFSNVLQKINGGAPSKQMTAEQQGCYIMEDKTDIKKIVQQAKDRDFSGWEFFYALSNGLSCYRMYDRGSLAMTAYEHGGNVKIFENTTGCPEVA